MYEINDALSTINFVLGVRHLVAEISFLGSPFAGGDYQESKSFSDLILYSETTTKILYFDITSVVIVHRSIRVRGVSATPMVDHCHPHSSELGTPSKIISKNSKKFE